MISKSAIKLILTTQFHCVLNEQNNIDFSSVLYTLLFDKLRIQNFHIWSCFNFNFMYFYNATTAFLARLRETVHH